MKQKQFENIVRQVRPALKRKAQSLLQDEAEAEDVVQDTLLKLWTIRSSLGAYRSVEGLAMVMAYRLSIDRLKRIKCEVYNGQEPDAFELSPQELLELRESEQKVDDILSRLPDKQSAILRMKHIDNLETAEIAQIIGSTEGAVRITLMRARNKVKEMFLNKVK